jgi:hypothetical protein
MDLTRCPGLPCDTFRVHRLSFFWKEKSAKSRFFFTEWCGLPRPRHLIGIALQSLDTNISAKLNFEVNFNYIYIFWFRIRACFVCHYRDKYLRTLTNGYPDSKALACRIMACSHCDFIDRAKINESINFCISVRIQYTGTLVLVDVSNSCIKRYYINDD